jgi:hypothetical protein
MIGKACEAHRRLTVVAAQQCLYHENYGYQSLSYQPVNQGRICVVEIKGTGRISVVTFAKVPTIDRLGTIVRCESDVYSKFILLKESLVCIDHKGLSKGVKSLILG